MHRRCTRGPAIINKSIKDLILITLANCICLQSVYKKNHFTKKFLLTSLDPKRKITFDMKLRYFSDARLLTHPLGSLFLCFFFLLTDLFAIRRNLLLNDFSRGYFFNLMLRLLYCFFNL